MDDFGEGRCGAGGKGAAGALELEVAVSAIINVCC